jgi:type I restriction enzyme, S subunit
MVAIRDLGGRGRPILKAGPFGSAVTKSTYVKSGFKVYGQQEVLSGNINAKNYYVTESVFRKLKSCAVEPGDILISMMGTVGKILVVPDGAEQGIINPRLMRISVDKRRVLPGYIASFLLSDEIQKLLENRAHGGTMQGLNTKAIESITLGLPPLPEQRRIAAVLDAWDTAISTAERLVAAKRARFDWLRDEVLTGRKRLRGFNDVWRDVRLEDVVQEHGLCATGKEEVFSVSVHKGLINQIEHLGRSFSAKDTSHYNRVLPGDIVYTKSPTGDFPLGIIKQSRVEQDVIVSPLYGVFTPESRELGIVLDAYFTSPKATEKYLTPLVQKGAKNTIAVTNTQFLQGALSVPSDDREIVALAELIAAALAELKACDAELERFRHQKRGLMQQLLTGKLRVPESIDRLIPDAGGADG